jgi:hypothetical protein
MKALHAAAYVSAAYAKPSGILTYSGAGGSSSVPLAARATARRRGRSFERRRVARAPSREASSASKDARRSRSFATTRAETATPTRARARDAREDDADAR